MTVLGAIARWLPRSPQRAEIRDDVAKHAVGRVAKGRHRDAGLNALRIGNPSPHVFGGIRELARDDRAPTDATERRTDIAVGVTYPVDVMARPTSEDANRRATARDGVVRRRMIRSSTTSSRRREQCESQQGRSARTQLQGRSWSSLAHESVARVSPRLSTPRWFTTSLWRVALLVLPAIACSSDRRSTDVDVPDPERGRELANTSGCGACHIIGGVHEANGTIGPPLTGIAQRSYIAGMLPNTPQNLALWIRVPQSVKPGNAMPDLGLSTREAEDIAAFLISRY